jgi:hypothetical protein
MPNNIAILFSVKKIKNKAISEYYKLLVSKEVRGRILCGL